MIPAALFMSAATMGISSPKMFQRSLCGEDFDEYVYRGIQEPFPFSPAGAATRELPDFWKHRHCKLFLGNKWREGRVCGWTQYNPTDRAMETCWIVSIELDTVEQGDAVELRLQGTVCNNIHEKQDTLQVTTTEPPHTVFLQPNTHPSIKPRMKFHVHRVNVHGGGTLKLLDDSNNDNAPLISLEWLEPPSPPIHLNEYILSLDCPCCRAAQPILLAMEPTATTTTSAECPVCRDTKLCRVLACGHAVCDECWNHVRQTALQVDLPLALNEEHVMLERKKRDRALRRRKHSTGNDFEQRFVELCNDTLTPSGLQRLHYELMVEPPCQWAIPFLIDSFDDLSIKALQVILQVITSRKDEMNFVSNNDGIMMNPAGDLSYYCCFCVARRLRDARDYRGAVPWAELALYYALHSEGGHESENLANAYLFSSEVHALADLLTQSLKDLTTCIELLPNNPGDERRTVGEREAQARNMLLEAMKEWTGSSGKLTEGI